MLEYDKKKLGESLRAARESAGMTQMEISAKMGYGTPQFISNIERGVSVIPLILLSKLIRQYKVSPEPFMKLIMESQRELLTAKLLGKRAKG